MDSLEPIFLLGPTGCGKSRMAVELAEILGNAEIVSADAYQVYRALPILTAAPEKDLLARVPHHLIGTMEVWETNDAASHARRALRIIDELQARGHRAIVTGGSGLYVKFISHGISPAPPSDPGLRAQIAEMSPREAVERLQQLDPEGAAHTDLKNPRYVARNLEIVLAGGGLPLSHWRGNWDHQALGPGFVLTPDTAQLDACILARSRGMVENGVIDEVAALLTQAEKISATAQKTLGLREVRQFLEGSLSRDQLISSLALSTRQYAKRQRTWLRREKWLVPICPGTKYWASEPEARKLQSDNGGGR